ncbi:hypothetical protein COB11_06485 [Candidatus Aerophobetes bacterium]|uniref:Uncharacterized protein n=1 Tax=Aerophobetes bacterium TaxID=2030807 RepID=A0A2A4YDA0_UNCAE|nr:MAG: hypothetical protein COB11_06485 [Candidatus Aerophobetes bacterium]
MKINRKVLSIPPHISTSWKNVASLHIQEESGGKVLVVTLENESIIEVPALSETALKEVFEAHTKFLDQGEESSVESKQKQNVTQKTPLQNPFAIAGENSVTFGMPFKMGDLGGLGNLGDFMHHNQEQANSPDLPDDMIEKITTVGKAIGLDKQLENMPKAEPHCNCPFCQVSRALHGDEKKEAPKELFNPDEEVSDEELSFKEWDIKQMGQDLYIITNPLDNTETYQVFLGKNLGCTCGHKNCEHLKAVLNS